LGDYLMSHNKTKIGTSTANRESVITPNLNDLDNVSGSASSGDVLQFDGSDWSPVAASTTAEVEFIYWGSGESEAYSGSPASNLSIGSTLYAYDTSGVNTITGATVSTTASTAGGSGSWLGSVTLPAGTYRVQLSSLPSFSSSGYFGFGFYDGSAWHSSAGTVGASSNTYSTGGSAAVGIAELTSSATLQLRIAASSGVDTVANQGNSMSESTTILIEKLA
jgi:hypothetical protein